MIDTDVASVLQRGRAPKGSCGAADAQVWLSFVTVGELWKWTEVRAWGRANRDRLTTWIAARPVVPSDDGLARTWGRLVAGARLRGPAATAERHVDRGVLCAP